MKAFVLNYHEQIGVVLKLFQILISLYFAYYITRKIIESDYTFRNIRTINNGLSVRDALEISHVNERRPFHERFNLLSNIYDRTAKKLLKVDEERIWVIYFFIFIKYFLPMLILIGLATSSQKDYIRYGIVTILMIVLPELVVQKSIRDHEKKFESYAYKLFKYINNQKSAGVTTHKIIVKLHKVVDDDEKLRNRMISFAAEYIATNDYNESIKKHLLKYYGNADALALDNALRQGLEIGDAFTDSEGYEKLMFQKYLNTIDYETEKQKLHSIFSALMFSMATVGLVGYILFVDISEGLITIFSK